MAKEYLLGQAEISTKAAIVRMSAMGTARCIGLTVAAIKANGRKVFNTA